MSLQFVRGVRVFKAWAPKKAGECFGQCIHITVENTEAAHHALDETKTACRNHYKASHR